MGSLVGKSFLIEGYFARFMYRSLYKMHEAALYGRGRTLLSMLSGSTTADADGEAALKLVAGRGSVRPAEQRSARSVLIPACAWHAGHAILCRTKRAASCPPVG